MTGLLAGLLGSFMISATSTLFLPFCRGWYLSEKIQYTLGMTLAGFSGTILDSLLGALFQASVVDVKSGRIVEGAGGKKVLLHGNALDYKKTAAVRNQISSHQDGKDGLAQTSGVDAGLPGVVSRNVPNTGSSGGKGSTEQYESRRVEVGSDLLDNNAVNIVMAATVAIGATVVACYKFGLPLTSILPQGLE